MLPDRVSNQGPLTYEPGALPTALRGPADIWLNQKEHKISFSKFNMMLVFTVLTMTRWHSTKVVK